MATRCHLMDRQKLTGWSPGDPAIRKAVADSRWPEARFLSRKVPEFSSEGGSWLRRFLPKALAFLKDRKSDRFCGFDCAFAALGRVPKTPQQA